MSTRGQHGYAMAALLVALSVMAILITAAMPVWHQAAQREKEAELVFRGQQYARAIGLFQRKSGPGVLPPNLDVLVDQKFLRKKYKDPITGKDFALLRPTQQPVAEAGRGRGANPASLSAGRAGGSTGGRGTSDGFVGGAAGGIMGVASTSEAESIRVYDGRTHYNEWQFVFVNTTQQPGGGAQGGGPGTGPGGGQRGGPGTGGPGGGPGNGPGFPGQGNGGRGGLGRGANPYPLGGPGSGPGGGPSGDPRGTGQGGPASGGRTGGPQGTSPFGNPLPR